MLEIFDGGTIWEESIPNEEDEVQEGLELDCLVVIGALGVFVQPEVDVESQLDQVGDMSGFGVGGGGHCGQNGVDNDEGSAFSCLT